MHLRKQQKQIRYLILLSILLYAVPAADDDVGSLVRDYDAYLRRVDPVRAGQRGDRDALRRWPDNSPDAVAWRHGELKSFQARIAALPPGGSAEDRLNRDLIAARVQDALAGLVFDEERIPFISGDDFYSTPDYAALNTVLKSSDDAAAWLARLESLPGYYATEVANMRRGLQTGFTQPVLTVERAIADLEARTREPLTTSALRKPLETLPAQFPAAERDALSRKADAVLATAVRPAEIAVLRFFREEYLPRARRDIGVSGVPGGRDYYAYLVRHHTTTNMTPAEIHALGQREAARIRAAMDEVRATSGFSGSFGEFLAFLRSDPRFYVSAARYGELASEIAKRADMALPRYFGRLPRLTYGVTPMPPGLESSANGYLPGSPEQGVPGLVVYKPWMADKLPTFGIAPWVLHEGVPGHHLQIALSQEQEGVAEFRRNDDITAFVEGWGLYAEKLGEEMGIYRDAWERFGRLSLEMWRACRLVIDTGIHVMGWSREQAAACLVDNSALAPAEIEFELNRYIAWPGQALAYKVGEQKIIALRHRAEQALGPRFDLRAFHDLVLDSGPMPLALLEQRVAAWIASR
jgi:uncharacterized protein (DUF885 family)